MLGPRSSRASGTSASGNFILASGLAPWTNPARRGRLPSITKEYTVHPTPPPRGAVKGEMLNTREDSQGIVSIYQDVAK